MDYQQLRAWRDVCEYLDSCWYKFNDPGSIIEKCPSIDHQLVTFEGRKLRSLLWDAWLIQFIRWGDHPILSFRNSRANKRSFSDERGWILVNGWESKIDFLEKVILFDEDAETLPKPWQALVIARMDEREIKRIKTRGSASERSMNNLCPHCGAAQIPFMMDCLNCGRCYEEF